MRTIKIFAGTLLIIAAPLSFLFSQAGLSPGEPDLVLPPFLLEVEEEDDLSVTAPLPGEEPLELPPLEMPVPAAADLQLSPADMQMPLPVQNAVTGEPQPGNASRFYSTGRIGAGLDQYVIGDIALHRFGPGLEFSLNFLHEGASGYGPDGDEDGYSRRLERLSGDLLVHRDEGSLTGEAGFREEAFGLQEVSSRDSLILRSYSAAAGVVFPVGTGTQVDIDVDFNGDERELSGALPSDARALLFSPSASWTLKGNRGSVGLKADYGYGYFAAEAEDSEFRHELSGGMFFSLNLPAGWELNGEGDVLWPLGEVPDYPFTLGVSGPLGDSFSLSLEGGRLVRSGIAGAVNEEHPFLFSSSGLDGERAWEGAASLHGTLGRELSLEGRILFRQWETLNQPGSVLPSGAWGISQVSRRVLSGELNADWQLLPLFHLDASWSFQPFFETDLLLPEQAVRLALEWGDPADIEHVLPWGASVAGEWSLYDSAGAYKSQLPLLSIKGVYAPVKGIRISAEINDILAPFLDEGRVLWDTYTSEGLGASLFVDIAL